MHHNSGKTVALVADAIVHAIPGELHTFIGPSYPTLEDGSWRTFKEMAGRLGILLSAKESKPFRATIKRKRGKADFVFRSAERPELLRAPSIPAAYIEEAALCRHEAFLVVLGCLRYRGHMGRLAMAFNPKGRRNWTYGVFYEDVPDPEDELHTIRVAKPNTYCVQAASWENPFAPPEFSELVGSQYTQRLREQELGGEFIDAAGLLFDPLHFIRVSAVPRDARRVRYWDCAATEPGQGTTAYSSGVLMAEKDGIYYVEDVVRGQWSYLKREQNMLATARRDAAKYNNSVLIYIEQEPGSGGKEAVQRAIKLLAEFPVRRDLSSGQQYAKVRGEKVAGRAKIARAEPYAAQVEAGNVRVLSARWSDDYIDEHAVFPESNIMDQVDASARAYWYLSRGAGRAVGGFDRLARRQADPAELGMPKVISPRLRRQR